MRRERPRPGAFRIVDHGGRWGRTTPWRATTSAGEPHDLSGLQDALRRAITWRIGHGAHRATLADLAELVGAEHRGSVWHAVHKLRMLNLIAYRAPLRGRNGTFTFWLPRANAARLAARIRSQRWPSRAGARPGRDDPSANVVTHTAFGGNLTREGLRRAWRARGRGGGPPVAADPRRGSSPRRSLRARRRPFPPRYVRETCPGTGHAARLELGHSETTSAGDVAATWSGRCRRDRRAIAVGLVLVHEPSSSWSTAVDVAATLVERSRPVTGATRKAGSTGADRAGPPALVAKTAAPARPPLPHRAELAAAAIADGLPADVADRLRIDHLGWRRRPLELPAERPAMISDAGGMDPSLLEAMAWTGIAADLAALADSRRLEPPAHEAPTSRTVTDRSILESDELVADGRAERANLVDGPASR